MYSKLRSVLRFLPSLPVQPIDIFFCDDMGNRVKISNSIAVRFAIGSGFVDAVNSIDNPIRGFYENIEGCSRMACNPLYN